MKAKKEQKEDKPELSLFPHISTGEETSFLIEKDKEDNPFFYEENPFFEKDLNQLNKEDENFLNNLNQSFQKEKKDILNPKTELSDYLSQQYCETIKKGRPPDKEKRKNLKHRYYAEDNIMRKIKAHFYKYVNETLKSAIVNKKYMLHQIPYAMVKNLEKEYNTHLINSTIREIYQESLIYNKEPEGYIYRKDKRKGRNKKILDYLSRPENQEKEKEVINLLNLNSIQFFEIFKMKNMETFLNELSIKYDKGYLDKVKNLCYNFEKWFFNKSGRIRKKNKK